MTRHVHNKTCLGFGCGLKFRGKISTSVSESMEFAKFVVETMRERPLQDELRIHDEKAID